MTGSLAPRLAAAWIAALSLLLSAIPANALAAQSPSSGGAAPTSAPVFRATVRRVVLDVVVTDSSGRAVKGLAKEDFSVAEDGKPQEILSFDANGFASAMDYLPPKLPPQPLNSFVNLPRTPEKGPLYVLLYDLVNMDNPDQMATPGDFKDQLYGRQQLLQFIKNKPEGARFAIFVWSDGLHLVQGFTSDKEMLLAAVDPQSPRPHVPRLFMMGANSGRGDPQTTITVLKFLAGYLDGLPGRKNLIWFSGGFPLSLFPSESDIPSYPDEIKSTLDLLVRNQISIYPVDVRGVSVENPRAAPGATSGGGLVSDSRDLGQSGVATSGGVTGGGGYSLLGNSYMIQDAIAEATGGHAFHSNNDVAGRLIAATENGESYYTLTYSPSNRDYNGKVRNIRIELAKKGYKLQYRHSYYGSDSDAPTLPEKLRAKSDRPHAPRKVDDTLFANMEHGAPVAHQLLFGAQLRTLGTPVKGTPEQMAALATQPAFFKLRHHNAPARSLPPIDLQRFAINYTVMAHQLQLQESAGPLNLEVAAAAYDEDGRILNAIVNNATTADGSPFYPAQARKAFRVEQEIDVPMAAKTIRLAVRDANTDRIGAMEITLPLAPEQTAAAIPGKLTSQKPD